METIIKEIRQAKTKGEIFALLERKSTDQLLEIALLLNIDCKTSNKDGIKTSIIRGCKNNEDHDHSIVN